MNVVVLTSSLGYREYNTTLMTMDGWTDSHGVDRHPTVVDERVNIGPFMAGDDHLYADIYYHDDEVDRIGADPDPKPERAAAVPWRGRSCSTSGIAAPCST